MTRYIEQTNLFKRQVKLAKKRGLNIDKTGYALNASDYYMLCFCYVLLDDKKPDLHYRMTADNLFCRLALSFFP